MKSIVKGLLLGGALLAAGTSPARAQGIGEIGAFGSVTRFDRSLDYGDGMGAGARLSFVRGARYRVFGVEGEIGLTNNTDGLLSRRHVPLRARLLYRLPLHEEAALQFGAGMVRHAYSADSVETVREWGYHGLLGLRLRLGQHVVFRLDGVIDYVASPANQSVTVRDNLNTGIHLGLGVPLIGKARSSPARGRKVRTRARAATPREAARPEPRAEPKPEPRPEPRPEPKRDLRFENVTFNMWDFELSRDAMRLLDEAARQLREDKSAKVEVAGHSDGRGSQTRNIRISLQRAEAVRAYLVLKGVDADRLVARGYGPFKPIATNETVEGRAMNRRVELKRID